MWDAAYSPNGRYIVSGAWDNTARLWDVDSRKTLFTLPAHVSDTWSVVFSPDGQLIASGMGNNKVKIWDVSTSLLIADLSGNQHTAEVEKVVFSPDRLAVASVSRDGTLKVWQTSKVESRVSVCVLNTMQQWSVKGEFEKNRRLSETDESQRPAVRANHPRLPRPDYQ